MLLTYLFSIDNLLNISFYRARQQLLPESTKKEIDRASSVVPNEFYKIKRMSKDHKKLDGKCMESCKVQAQLSIDDGDDDTFKHPHARLLQATKEEKDMIEEKTAPTRSPSLQAPMDSLRNELSDEDADDNVTLLQLRERVEIMPQPPYVQVRNQKQMAKANSKNNSRLGNKAKKG